MQTYLKTKPVWIQLLLFLGMAMGIFVATTLIGSSIVGAVSGLNPMEMGPIARWDKSDPRALAALRGMLLLQFLGLFSIPSLLFSYFSDPRPLHYLGLRQPSKAGYWIVGIALLFIAIPLVEATGVLNKKINFGTDLQTWAENMEAEATQTIQFMLAPNSWSGLVLNLIFIAGFAAVGEELFFRGVLQRLFIRGAKSPWVGITIAAFFFSFFHFQFFGFIPRFFLGMVLGAIYWYSGSLWTAIAAHFAYDALIIVLYHFNPQMVQNPDAPILPPVYMGTAALISAAGVGLLMWWMKRHSRTSYAEEYREDEEEPSQKDFTF